MSVNRVVITVLFSILVFSTAAEAQEELQRKIDSLFVIASSGEVRYRDMNEPAMDSIAALGQPAVPFLIEKFKTKSARERWTVIWILQRIGSAAVPDLVDALDRENGLIVQRVCWALGDIKDSTAVEPLMEVTEHSRWQVRDQSVGALGKIGDKRADDVVMQRLNDPIGEVRKAAVVASGQLQIFEAIAAVVHRLGDEFYGARMAAVDALGKLDTATVVATLIDSASSSNPMTAALVCRVLGDLGTDRAKEKLFQLATGGGSDIKVHAAVELIKSDPLNNCGYHEKVLQAQTGRLERLKVESALYTAQHGQEEPSQ